MKHLSSILLSIGVILSVVAIILPQWATGVELDLKAESGLWEACAAGSCSAYNDDTKPKDILVSQILSIVGTIGLAVGAVMCMMMKPRYSKLAAGLGVACLTAVLIVYATVTNNVPDVATGESHHLGASFWLELSAAVVGLLGLFVPAAKK
jgi:hypothetical protein